MAEDSDLEKSEQPTQTKLDKAKEKGQAPRSKELTSVLLLLAGVGMLWSFGGVLGSKLIFVIQSGLTFDAGLMNNQSLLLIHIKRLLGETFIGLLPIFLGLIIVAVSVPMVIGGLIFSLQALKPDISRLNPLNGFKQMFSSRVLAELVKGLLKAALISIMTGWFLWSHLSAIIILPGMPLTSAIEQSLYLIVFCSLLAILSLCPMVGFDVFYQLWSNLKKLKMTKQEVRDEFKEQEGDPQIKARIRQQQRAMSRRRMFVDAAKADVIVTNPTHYAVALRYDEKNMAVPKVVAKGSRLVALRIRELAQKNRIPQLEAPALARALYRHTEIGQTIPAQLYSSVAQVLAWVYQLRRWQREGGIPPSKPHDLAVPKSMDFLADEGE